MRLRSLIILGALVAVVVLFFIDIGGFKTMLFDYLKGYTAADTPAKAQDFFTKAIKAREYRIAAKYVKGNYAESLVKVHSVAAPMGETIDWLTNYGKNKQIESPRSDFLLYSIDPFPPVFETDGEPKKADNEDKALARWRPLPLPKFEPPHKGDAMKMDPLMMKNCLALPMMLQGGIWVVPDGAEGQKTWKLQIDIPNDQINLINHLIANHIRYQTGLDDIKQEINRNVRSYADKNDYANTISRVIAGAGNK